MIETTPEGFKLLIGSDNSRRFMIDSDRLDDCLNYIRWNDIRFIGINTFMGYKKRDIDFLSEIANFVEGVIVPEGFSDMSVLNTLHKLKTLGFADNKKTVIDLLNFPNLSTLACDYSKRLLSLESCKLLRNLTLTRFKPTNGTLEELPRLASLTTLNLFLPRIVSLAGIGEFPSLNELTLFRAGRLENISAVQNVSNTLVVLEIDQCRKIRNYELLATLANLEKLIIGRSAPISSLSFVKSLTKLGFISFVGTNIVDGDLSPTVGIGYVGFENRRHYSHKFEEILNAKPGGG